MTTPAQQRTYQFIQQFLVEKGYAPSFAEIAAGTGLSSKSLVHRHLQALQTAGLIELTPGKRRQLKLTNQQFNLPLLGRIAAGTPIEAIPEQDSLNLLELLLGKAEQLPRFALVAQGNSMIERGIQDGDIILCESRQHAKNGDIVVALIDQQEATLKYIHYNTDQTVTLIPANSQLAAKTYAAERIQIQGVFVGLIRL